MATEETSIARARSTFHRYARITQLQMAQPTIVDTGLPRSNLLNKKHFELKTLQNGYSTLSSL